MNAKPTGEDLRALEQRYSITYEAGFCRDCRHVTAPLFDGRCRSCHVTLYTRLGQTPCPIVKLDKAA